VLIGKDVVLEREKDTSTVHQVNQRQAILHSDALGAKKLFAGDREERASLNCSIVRYDHYLPFGYAADTGDDSGRWSPPPVLVHAPGSPQPQFKEAALGIDQVGNSLASREPAFLVLADDGFGTAPLHENLFFAT